MRLGRKKDVLPIDMIANEVKSKKVRELESIRQQQDEQATYVADSLKRLETSHQALSEIRQQVKKRGFRVTKVNLSGFNGPHYELEIRKKGLMPLQIMAILDIEGRIFLDSVAIRPGLNHLISSIDISGKAVWEIKQLVYDSIRTWWLAAESR